MTTIARDSPREGPQSPLLPSAPEPNTALRFGFSGRSLRPEERGRGAAHGGGGGGHQGGRGSVHEQVVPTAGRGAPAHLLQRKEGRLREETGQRKASTLS